MDLSAAAVHRRFVDEVVIAKRVQLIDELFTEDAEVEQGSLGALREQMQAQADGLNITVTYLHEFVADEWVIHHMALRIEHVGEFLGATGTGRVVPLIEVEAARVVDGRIAEMWSVADRTAAMIDLGMQPPGRGASPEV